MPYTVPSIRQEGLQPYLDRKLFNGKGYMHLAITVEMTRKPSGKPNAAAVARVFGVSAHTAKGWLEVYAEEQAKHEPNTDQTIKPTEVPGQSETGQSVSGTNEEG